MTCAEPTPDQHNPLPPKVVSPWTGGSFAACDTETGRTVTYPIPEPVPVSELLQKRCFGLARVSDDVKACLDATQGHTAPIRVLGAPAGVRVWTRLVDHPTVAADYRFLDRFNPETVVDELYRKANMVKVGNERIVTILIQQWADHPDFLDRWWLDEPSREERACDLADALEMAQRMVHNLGQSQPPD